MVPGPEDGCLPSTTRFATVLRARRLSAGLTQKELAQLAGIGVRTVRELERARVHRPQCGTLALLADAFGLTGAAREDFTNSVRSVSER
ncbi:MAG: helix-turn-helix transcriptional regulator [Dactylosporangium sp.]|nr:helix-turn-helix transcriptional regulator [Dactylosporangium sp.]NNJ61601.1 helix-turn-helix transcriptional regulator [Dactylosporangium sp.]